MALIDRFIVRTTRREPDFVIGGPVRPYLRRWWIIPRNRVFNVYLHEFRHSDDDRALHDHPWLFNVSILLHRNYREHTKRGVKLLQAPAIKIRIGPSPHRIELFSDHDTGEPIPCWTLFITGPRVREWGFHCPRGWVHWREFTAPGDKGTVGKGCD